MKANTLEMFLYNTRVSLGITKKELANQLGVSERTVSYWESEFDARTPSLSYLYKLSLIFNISINDMLF